MLREPIHVASLWHGLYIKELLVVRLCEVAGLDGSLAIRGAVGRSLPGSGPAAGGLSRGRLPLFEEKAKKGLRTGTESSNSQVYMCMKYSHAHVRTYKLCIVDV